MNDSARLRTWFAGAAVSLWIAASASAAAQAQQPAASGGPFRKLAPGVMETIEPDCRVAETVSRHDVVELLAVDPKLDFAKNVPFRRDVWCLEFQFKPVRMIRVDVPQADGHMRRQLIWYMVYRVTNRRQALHPVTEPIGSSQGPRVERGKTVEVDKTVRFIPEFVLESPEYSKAYPDRVIPIAMGPIQMREDPARKFFTSVTIAEVELAPGESAWGVAFWEDVDPRIDRFSIYVTGLTNAYRWKDEPGRYKPGDVVGRGRRLYRKTLKLNFWRPGDEYNENEKEIRYGVPGEVDYEWVYR